MNSKYYFLFIFMILSNVLFAQRAVLKGIVTDSKTKEALIGVSILADDSLGLATDINGRYEVSLSGGTHNLIFRFIGYNIQKKAMVLKPGESTTLNIVLEESATELNVVVISAGKFEQKLSDVTVSMEVIKPAIVQNRNTTSMETMVNQIPGVTVTNNNASIRGGSGFSYGAGSRVLLLVDELPMLTADAGDVKWSFLPVENLEQIEVIKGASSAMFGSSALNGVINVRTAYPKEIPETNITLFSGAYDTPQRKETKWWGSRTQMTHGGNFFHSRQIKNFDLVVGGNLFKDDGYRQGENEERFRFNVNTRYRFKSIEGLSVGINANHQEAKGGNFLFWQDDSAGVLKPFGGLDSGSTISHYTTFRTNIDPFITYFDKNGNTHRLRTRFFNSKNINDTKQGSNADLYYGEYQFQKHFNEIVNWTSGVVGTYSNIASDLYKNHTGKSLAFFTQMDTKVDKFAFSFGVRFEKNIIDTVKGELTPVFRSGINYHLFKETYIRASYGQGYRFPAIAEKFVKTNVGTVYIYPDTALRSETGWSGEVGIKQGLKLGNWLGYLDVAGFWTEYKDMMEFTFGRYDFNPRAPLFGFGFSSVNIGNTQIYGLDVSLTGQGKILGLPTTILAGYTYMDPTQKDFNPKLDTIKNSANYNILKYRYRDIYKVDIESTYKKVSLGISFRYNSFMENIDKVFESLIPGVKDYRKNHHNGDSVFDGRLAFEFAKYAKLAFICKNVFNREYVGRPADMQPPRSFVLQFTSRF